MRRDASCISRDLEPASASSSSRKSTHRLGGEERCGGATMHGGGERRRRGGRGAQAGRGPPAGRAGLWRAAAAPQGLAALEERGELLLGPSEPLGDERLERRVHQGQARLRRRDARRRRLAGAGRAVEEQRGGARERRAVVRARAAQHGRVRLRALQRQQQRLLHLTLHLRRPGQRRPAPLERARARRRAGGALGGRGLRREHHPRAHPLQELDRLLRVAR